MIESYFYPDQEFSQKSVSVLIFTPCAQPHCSFPLIFHGRRHVIITTAIVFSTMLISLVTCDLGIVLELTGGLSATVLAFVVSPLRSDRSPIPPLLR